MEKTVMFTGHRVISDSVYPGLADALGAEVEKQILSGAKRFRAGGARGFDTLAALTVLSLRRKYPDVRLELILPCPSQPDQWPLSDRRLYEQILGQADEVRYVSPVYFSGVLQQRNRALVEGADVCVAYLTTSHGGGTAFTAALALRSGLEFVNLSEAL